MKVKPLLFSNIITSGMVCHQNVHFQVQLLLLRPKTDWNQTEHCLNYQLQNKR